MFYGFENESATNSYDSNNYKKLNFIKFIGKKIKEKREFNLSKHPERTLKMFRKDNTGFIYLFMLVIVLLIVFFVTRHYYLKHLNSPYIQKGIYVKGLDISYKTKDEAIEFLNEKFGDNLDKAITLQYKNVYYSLTPEQIDAKFDIESTVNYAYQIARKGKFLNDIFEFINVYYLNINIEPEFSYSENDLNNYLVRLETKLPDQLQQPDYYLEDDELIIVNGKVGAGIYRGDLKKDIVNKLKDLSFSNAIIDIPTFDQLPNSINLDDIYTDIYREKKNAYFTTEPYAVYPEVVGRDFDLEGVRNWISENPNSEEYKIALNYYKPEVTTNDIGMEAFPDLLSSFSTEYYESNQNRTTNLRLAANKINGTVIMPGETFSFNQVVGKRTVSAGYKNAAIYSQGQVVDGLAGGICQVSSTLYNAALFADMNITSRTNHMFIPTYVKGGRDATVVWGSIDFKFKNERNYPIKIKTSVSDGICKVSFYGLRRENEYEIKIETNTIRTIKFDTQYQKNSNYSKGSVIQSGQNGSVVDSYRLYYLNGELVNKEKLYRDTYDAEPRIIAR